MTRNKKSRSEILIEIGLLKIGSETRTSAILFVCGQPMFKLHPTFFDAVVKEIIRRDVHSHVILLRGEFNDWTTILAERLSANIGQYKRTAEGQGRIHLIPRRSRIQFLRLMAGADVAMDTYPFGGGVTTLETLAVGTPVVTLPDSRYLRGRFTYHYLSNILNLKELIVNETVTNEVELQHAVMSYVDKLYEVQRQSEKIRLKILRRKHLLFEAETGRREWMKFLERMRKNVKKTRKVGSQTNVGKAASWKSVPRQKRL
jgi:predicted O-linked N-acetylglucosamine transferase (SPINDLY family)